MKRSTLLLLLGSAGCIAPSVLAPEARDATRSAEARTWRAASPADVTGTYVSVALEGRLAAVLRMLVYDFHDGGTYTGAALIDDAPPRFEVLSGTWALDGTSLVLDDAPPATLDVADDGALRLTGPQGAVVLRREERR